MAQAQTQAFQSSQQGLQSFLDASPDYELAPIGLGSLRGQAEKLAEYGRYGDIYVVHAAEGETVVPMEVLEANPKIKSLLFDQMSEMGLDPERYVVGNDLNSLNPVTGMPEFFFKKLWKSVKGYMPIIASTVGNMIAPGLGGIIGAGLGTKLAGESWGAAAKAAGIAWAGQAFMGGVRASLSNDPNKTFVSGFMSGAKAPIQGVQGAFGSEQYANPFKQGILYNDDVGLLPEYDSKYQTVAERQASTEAIDNRLRGLRQEAVEQKFVQTPWGAVPEEVLLGGPPGTPQQYTKTSPAAVQRNYVNTAANTSAPTSTGAPTNAGADTGPYLGKWSPTGSNLGDAAAAAAVAYAGGLFEGEEPEKTTTGDLAGVVNPAVTGETLLAKDPAKFRIGDENLDPNVLVSDEDVEVPTTFAAQGGTINYPRRTGQITGPGTGTSDSIPAMLSNGEFVMTKKAVDGAGGPGTMYDMMRNFEMRT